MRLKSLTVPLVILLLISPLFVNGPMTAKAQTTSSQPLYFGIDAAFADVAQTEQLIDNVSSYTNFFIIGCAQKLGTTYLGEGVYNETRLTVISQYLYDKGLNFIVYSDDPSYPSHDWLETASKNYGSHFMGIYYFDEPGGKTLDQANYPVILSADNFTDAADQYVATLNSWLRGPELGITRNFDSPDEYPLFTSDYGLYWYDYAAGYNTVFAEFGLRGGEENYSRQLNIALCRGAATAFNQDWGVIITWSSYSYPYMENSTQLYNDMVLAYGNGAKYIVVFDTDKNYTNNVLSADQLNAMKQFWQYTQNNPRTPSQPSDRTAYVLPQDFGYGFRDPNDTIWGLYYTSWNGTASLTFVTDISMCVYTFLQMMGSNLDIVYPSANQTVQSIGYKNVIYWNDNTIVPNMPSMPPQSYAVSARPPVNLDGLFTSFAKTLVLYAIIASIVIALAVFGVALRFRRQHQLAKSSK